MLTLVTLLAFANAWPDALVLDDKMFAGEFRPNGLESLTEAFNRDVWNHLHISSGLYRPLLLINLELESRLFGSWNQGYHLVNIAFHLLVTLFLYGFLRKLLQVAGKLSEHANLAALVTALVFAVHPIHTEVVNSVFNRSSMQVALLAIMGLWWLLHYLDSRPARAWLGLGLSYFLALGFKESAAVIPGIAAVMVFVLTDGSFWARTRRMLPVFWLLIPLGIYLFMRAHGLSAGGLENATSEVEESLGIVLEQARLPGTEVFLAASAVIGQAMKVMAWPYPLFLYHEPVADELQIPYLVLNAVMIGSSIVLFLRGRPGLAMGLAFFYLAIIPASRLLGSDGNPPHLAERYLYFPSIGLTISLAFGICAIIQRFSPRLLIALTLPLLLLLTALTWERNADWTSETFLFETEYDRGHRGPGALRLLIGAHGNSKNYPRVREICLAHVAEQEEYPRLASNCGAMFAEGGDYENAIRSMEMAAENKRLRPGALLNLARIYSVTGNREASRDNYLKLRDMVSLPEARLYLEAEMLLRSYPRNRDVLNRAIEQLDQALQLRPEYPQAQALRDEITALLEKADAAKAGEESGG